MKHFHTEDLQSLVTCETVIWRSLLGAGALIHKFVCNEKRVIVTLQTATGTVQPCISTVTIAMSGTNLFLDTIHPQATIPIRIALIIIIIGKGLYIANFRRYIIQQEAYNIFKHKDFTLDIQRMWNVKTKILVTNE